MPTYDFLCMRETCSHLMIDHRLESYKEPNPLCPHCGGIMSRLTSSNNIMFKGLPLGDKHYNSGKKEK